VARVEGRDGPICRLEQRGVPVDLLGVGVAGVRQEREVHGAVVVGQEVDLEGPHQGAHLVAVGQQHRDDQQGPERDRDPVSQLEPGQVVGRDRPAHQLVDDGRGHGGRRHRGEHARREQLERTGAHRGRRAERRGQDQRRRAAERGGVGERGPTGQRPREPDRDRRLIPQAPLQRRPPGPEQQLAGVLRRPGGLVRHSGGHRRLAEVRPPRQLLDHVAVAIAGVEVRARSGHLPEGRFDGADPLHEVGPVDGAERPQAVDPVADRAGDGGLETVLLEHRLLGGGAGSGELLVEPRTSGSGPRIGPPEALDELHQERALQAAPPVGPQLEPQRRARGPLGIEQRVGEVVCRAPRAPPGDDAVGQAAEVLDQHRAQDRGRGPQLGERQRGDPLVGDEVVGEPHHVEPGLDVLEPRPGGRQDARRPGERAVVEARQRAVAPKRERLAELPDRLAEERGVVHEPLGGWRDGLPRARLPRDGVDRAQERQSAGPEVVPPGAVPGDRGAPWHVVARELPGRHLQAVGGEQDPPHQPRTEQQGG
jgi:hypothetical protein